MKAVLLASLMLTTLATDYPAAGATPLVIDFESVELGPQGFDNNAGGGDFVIDNVAFNNDFVDFGSFDFWSGWSFSRTADVTTPGVSNQFSAFANLPDGGGAGGSEQYAVAFSAADVGTGLRPTIELPAGALPASVEIANTTFAALNIIEGDGFGGPFGAGDNFQLTISAVDSQQQTLASIDVVLANFPAAGVGEEPGLFLLDDWTEIDLTPLRVDGVTELSFQLASTDTGPFGINTPVYFAIDNLTLDLPPVFDPDANGDGLVDAADYVVLRDTGSAPEAFDAFRADFTPTGVVAATSTVPEPNSVFFAVVLCMIPSLCRDRPATFPILL